MKLGRAGTLLVLVLLKASVVFGQANGKLQIHFMDVGQGDGAVLISPAGEVVLFDHGVSNRCGLVLASLERLAVTKIDYMISSHHHADHIGCTEQVLLRYPLLQEAYDRGGSYSSATFNRYVAAVGIHRTTASANAGITLDAASADPVQITFVALNGDGLVTNDENSLSLVSLVSYGHFRVEISGDLTGTDIGAAVDVETQVGPKVGSIDVYKVHHHCSRYSTNENWLLATTPTVAIVSVGDGNSYGHPTPDCLARLHTAGTITYWTEFGSGAAEPDPAFDVVAGNILIETLAAPVGQTFTVSYAGGFLDTYSVKPREPPGPPPEVWQSYHDHQRLSAELAQLAAAFPNLVTLESAGKSVQGRDLWLLTITNKSLPGDKPKVFFDGAMHGSEVIASESMLHYVKFLVEQYSTDLTAKEIVDGWITYVVPMVNPDGVEGGKNSDDYKDARKNTNKVDLNRNFNFNWPPSCGTGPGCTGVSGTCGADTTCTDTCFQYPGFCQFSELESGIISAQVRATGPVLYLSGHAGLDFEQLIRPGLELFDGLWP